MLKFCNFDGLVDSQDFFTVFLTMNFNDDWYNSLLPGHYTTEVQMKSIIIHTVESNYGTI